MANPRNEHTLNRKFAIEITNNVWETAEASFTYGEDVPEGMDKDEHASMIVAYVKAKVDESMKMQKAEILDGRGSLAGLDTDPRPAAIQFAEEAGATVERMREGAPKLSGAEVQAEIDAVREEKPPLPNEEYNVPIDDAGNELQKFQVTHFEVGQSQYGNYLKAYGWPSKGKPWVPAWKNVAEDLFSNLEEFDAGQTFPPPYPVMAFVTMGEYKGRPSPDSVAYWERIK